MNGARSAVPPWAPVGTSAPIRRPATRRRTSRAEALAIERGCVGPATSASPATATVAATIALREGLPGAPALGQEVLWDLRLLKVLFALCGLDVGRRAAWHVHAELGIPDGPERALGRTERGVGDGLDRPFALGLVAIRFDRECGLPRDAFPRKTLALRTAARDPLAIAPAPSSPASAATATTTSRFALPGSLALGQRLAFRSGFGCGLGGADQA